MNKKEKAFIIITALIIFSLVALSIAVISGIFFAIPQHLRGFLFIGLCHIGMPSLSNVLIIFSYLIGKKSFKSWAFIIWTLLTMAVLWFAVVIDINTIGGIENDIEISREVFFVVFYWMMAFAFPIGFVTLFALTGIIILFSVSHLELTGDFNAPAYFVIWLLLFISGVFQWFVLLPYLIKKITTPKK